MVRYLLVGILCASSVPALCQTVNYNSTKAEVTYQASTIWIDGVGPALGLEIHVRGQINRDAFALVRRYYDNLLELDRRYRDEMSLPIATKEAINVHLDSVGGNVDAAIEIGRFVRDKQANVMVIKEAKCASACVLILAGGATRHVAGKLGVHRPFLETPSRVMTTHDVQNVAAKTLQQLRAYFREMNISERLADDMMMIPTNQIRWLSPQEIAVYGLGVDDPVIQEANVLKRAQKYGLSRFEYDARWQRVQRICTLGSPSDCEDKIMRGVQSPR